MHKVGPGGYQDDKYIALFAGVAPVDDPRLVTVVVIDEPQGDDYGGGAAAAPVYSAVTEGALRLLNIPPSMISGNDESMVNGELNTTANQDAQPGGAA